MGPGKDTHGTLGPDQREGRGWHEHSSAQQHSAEARQTWWRSAGSKSIVDKSLLCYGGPTDQEVNEVIHENFHEKECYDSGCKPLMLKMGVFEVVDEKEEKEHEIQEVREGWSKRHQGGVSRRQAKTTCSTPT